MKNLHKVISAEIERLDGLRPVTTVQQAARAGAIKEATEALPRNGESPLEWAERNAVWFQCPGAMYREGFFEDVDRAGEQDYEESLI